MKAYDKETEVKAWKVIKEAAEKALTKYPTTLQQDIEIL